MDHLEAILDKKWIGTAAHCVEEFDFSSATVKVGNSNSKYGVNKIIRRYVVNPRRNKDTQSFDIALIEFEEDLTFNDQIQLIEMIESKEYIAEGSEVIFSGYGVTKEGCWFCNSNLKSAKFKTCQPATKETKIENVICIHDEKLRQARKYSKLSKFLQSLLLAEFIVLIAYRIYLFLI